MTLRELYALIKEEEEDCRVPGKQQLLDREDRAIVDYEKTIPDVEHVRIIVYESGYVIYEEDSRTTVFRIRDAVTEPFADDKADIWDMTELEKKYTKELLMDTDWRIGLILYGNGRVMNNTYYTESKKVTSYSWLSEDVAILGYYCNLSEEMDFQIAREKMDIVFETLMRALKPKEWAIYTMIERDGLLQKDIAQELGITQQAVSKAYNSACIKILDLKTALKKLYYED